MIARQIQKDSPGHLPLRVTYRLMRSFFFYRKIKMVTVEFLLILGFCFVFIILVGFFTLLRQRDKFQTKLDQSNESRKQWSDMYLAAMNKLFDTQAMAKKFLDERDELLISNRYMRAFPTVYYSMEEICDTKRNKKGA